MQHWHSLGEIVSWTLHGLWQYVLELAPFVDPSPEPGKYPGWWPYYATYWDWYGHRDGRDVPDRHLIETWLRGCWGMLGRWIEEVGEWARDAAQEVARSWIGWVQHSFPTFSAWLDQLWTRFGPGMVFWAEHAVQALGKLWDWIPSTIRYAMRSWDELFQFATDKATYWVKTTYDWVIGRGKAAWDWVSGLGESLRTWWESARGVLDEFRANPWSFIQSRLGPAWDRLNWFDGHCLAWYADLWSQYKQDLADFLADPAGWIYGKLELYIERIW
jgi:hypothetical protein